MKVLITLIAVALACSGVRSPANAVVYHGFPHLHLTMAVVDAGGGAEHFDARLLMDRLAGSSAASENELLIKRFGSARVRSYYRVFTFAIGDALKKAHNMLIPLPASAQPDPSNARALATALYDAGRTKSGRYDCGYMLEVLMSHQIHHDIMGDMDKRFTPPVNGDFHVILTSAMQDLHREYGPRG